MNFPNPNQYLLLLIATYRLRFMRFVKTKINLVNVYLYLLRNRIATHPRLGQREPHWHSLPLNSRLGEKHKKYRLFRLLFRLSVNSKIPALQAKQWWP